MDRLPEQAELIAAEERKQLRAPAQEEPSQEARIIFDDDFLAIPPGRLSGSQSRKWGGRNARSLPAVILTMLSMMEQV